MTGPLTRLEPMPTATAAPLVLGIESSCDETGVGVVRGTALLAHEVASSVEEHVRFGGVIPEIAARAHLEALVPTIRRALDTADVTLADLDAIAVTSGPGLAGALMVGVAGAKALATALGTPLYGINHLVAHVGVGMLDGVRPAQWDDLPADLGALLVSGGHTEILRVGRISSEVELLGSTIDDAAGEAYDKVARLIGAGYPGGPVIDRLAAEGDPTAFRFPRGLTAGKFVGSAEEPGPHRHDWSFSGLKTAVSRAVEQFEARGLEVPRADIAASFEQAVVDVLVTKSLRAVQERGLDTLVIVGGVAANARLRAVAQERCDAAGVELRIPPPRLCTDNGAMIAAVGDLLVRSGAEPSGLSIAADPSAVLHGAQLPLLR